LVGRTQPAGDERACVQRGPDRARLIEDNVPLARHLARRFARSRAPDPDLVQAAMVGLVEAASRFDPSYEVPFAAFATKTILGELKRFRRDTAWTVHVGRRVKEVALQLPRTVQTLRDELGRSPTPDEIAGRLRIPVETCLEAMDARAADRPLERGLRAAEVLEAAVGHDSRFSTVEERDAVARWMGRLSDAERQAVFFYFWGELSQSDIADRLGINQMAVSRMLSRALGRMRAWALESA
jgi:RNA polymerase sigma-B factor